MSRKELIKTEAMSKKIKSPIIVLLGVVIISIGCSSESTKQKSKDDVVERKVKNKIQLDQLHCIGDSIYYTIKDNITKPVGEAAATYRLFLCTLVLYICIRRSTQVTLCSANPNAYCAEVNPRGLLEI